MHGDLCKHLGINLSTDLDDFVTLLEEEIYRQNMFLVLKQYDTNNFHLVAV